MAMKRIAREIGASIRRDFTAAIRRLIHYERKALTIVLLLALLALIYPASLLWRALTWLLGHDPWEQHG